MLDFEKVKSLRDELVDSLVHWQSPKDGFYRSSPIVKGDSPPSFTNTGIVLQAFNESSQNHLAQALADRLIEYFKTRAYEPFPHEKATSAQPKAHVLCNSWPVFSILDCYPSRVREFNKIFSWFTENQKNAGDWDLIPGEETRYPIFSAYVLSALLQFYDCYHKMGIRSDDLLGRVKEAVELGFDFLLKNRTASAINEDLLLWPASLNDIERNPISFGTSAICMHMLAKASRLLARKDWEKKVEKTFLSICDSFRQEQEDNFAVGRMKVNIWEQLQVNESSLNYSFAFFAPINLTTLLRFSTSQSFRDNANYYYFISHLTNWILDNQTYVEGRPGIRGGKYINEVKTWSTAYSIIVLSRILNQAYTLVPLIDKQGDTIMIQRIDDILSSSSIPMGYKVPVIAVYNLIVIGLALCAYHLFGDSIQSKWPQIAGKWTFIVALVALVMTLIGLNIASLRNRILGFVYGTLIRLIKIRRIEKIWRDRGAQ